MPKQKKTESTAKLLNQIHFQKQAISSLKKQISELTHLNNILYEKELLSNTLINNAPDAFFAHDTAGKFKHVNDYTCHMLGYSKEELMTLTVKEIEAGMSDDQVKEYWDNTAEGNIINAEGLLKRKDGSYVPAEIRLGQLEILGEMTIYGIARDVSQRKQLETSLQEQEERLRQSYKMEAVGTLAGGIAHDFNNIISIILGYAELGGNQLSPDHKTYRFFTEIQIAAQRAKDVVQQLLNFSQKSSTSCYPMPIASVVRESLRLIRSTIPANIDLHIDINDSCGMITTNSAQIHQLVINLCTNAAYAVADGGSISVSLNNYLPDSQAEGEPLHNFIDIQYLHLSVKDTGSGIAPDIIDRIYEPYFTTKEVGKGSGMGLAVVHGIMQSIGGMIEVHSNLGVGTTFDIFLPVSEDAVKKPVPSNNPPTDLTLPTGNERILLVDDETSIINIQQELLETLGYQVEKYTSPLKALVAFSKKPLGFDLLITDMAMPELTGDKLIAQIKEQQDIPVILCTGFSERIDLNRPDKIQADTILLKPVSTRQLATAIRTVLDT